MSYIKQTWVTGEVITAEKLNHMEDGISAANGAHTKTLNIVNNTSEELTFFNCIVNGYWDEKTVAASGSASFQYVTPASGFPPIPFIVGITGTLTNVNVTAPEGITFMGEGQNELYIVAGAADGATVTFATGAQ